MRFLLPKLYQLKHDPTDIELLNNIIFDIEDTLFDFETLHTGDESFYGAQTGFSYYNENRELQYKLYNGDEFNIGKLFYDLSYMITHTNNYIEKILIRGNPITIVQTDYPCLCQFALAKSNQLIYSCYFYEWENDKNE